MPTLTNNNAIAAACNYAVHSDSICLTFDMTTDCIKAYGQRPSVSFTVPSGVQPANATFTIGGVVFSVDNTLTSNTATAYRSSGVVTTDTERIRAMLQSNAAFTDTTITVSGSLIVITWNEKKAVTPWTNTAGGTSLLFGSIVNGIDIEYYGCCTFGFEVFMVGDTGEEIPLTGLIKRTVPLSINQLPTPITVELNEVMKSALWTQFAIAPTLFDDPILDYNMRRCFYVRYFKMDCENNGDIGDCGLTRYPATTSPIIKAVNAALPDDNQFRLCPFTKTGNILARALTMRPNYTVCVDEYDWIWVLLDATIGGAPETYTMTATDNFGAIITVPLPTLANESGNGCGAVWRIPSGVPNLGIDPAATSYTISITTTSGIVQFSQTFAISSNCANCISELAAPVLYFMNDYGAYDSIRFCEAYEQTIGGSNESICVNSGCIDPIRETDTSFGTIPETAQRLSNGGALITKSAFKRAYKVAVENPRNDETTIKFIEAFMASRSTYAMFRIGTSNFLRKIYVDAGSVTVYRKKEKPRIEFTFYYTEIKQTAFGGEFSNRIKSLYE